MSELLFNELPRPTFRWLRVNHTVSSLAGEDTSVQSIAVEANQNILSPLPAGTRSEERRVGKECRSRWSPYH